MNDAPESLPLLVGLYRRMREIRVVEERVVDLRSDGLIQGSVHLCNGQEAICVGTAQVLDLTRDAVFPTYRGHGWGLACGLPVDALLGEMMGREIGVNSGRGGSAYHFAPDYGVYGENSIVGAGTVIASGSALASTFDGSGRVSVAVIGDGAMNQGAVHEAMNFASVRKLPVLFIVENNDWSEMTAISETSRTTKLFTRAGAYRIPSARVDGNDVFAVIRTMREAVQRIRSGQGPMLIEAKTARIVGHYIGDMQHYRPQADIDAAFAGEPLVRARERLIGMGLTGSDIDEIDAEVAESVERAIARAKASPLTNPATVTEHLYA